MREHYTDNQHFGAHAPPCPIIYKNSRNILFLQIFYMADN